MRSLRLCAVKKRAEEVLGEPNASLWLNQGKVYNTPGWSGRYLADLVGSSEGRAVLQRFLDAVEAGDAVPVVPMDRFDAGEFRLLQLINGQLQVVRADGKRQPV